MEVSGGNARVPIDCMKTMYWASSLKLCSHCIYLSYGEKIFVLFLLLLFFLLLGCFVVVVVFFWGGGYCFSHHVTTIFDLLHFIKICSLFDLTKIVS